MNGARTLAHLIEAGIPATQAWQLSRPDIDKLPANEIVELELVWGFATRIGAPLGEAMSQFHEFARDQARSQREREQAQAVPSATRKLLLWLPLMSLAFAQLAGFDLARGFSHPVGMASAVLSAGLLWLGARWSRSYLALPDEPRAEVLTLILMQLALRSGIGVTAAKRLCLAELEKLGDVVEFDSATEVIALSAETGAAVADLMLARATELREQAATRSITAAQRASVKLLLPLGLTALPAFLLLTLTPIFISLVTQ